MSEQDQNLKPVNLAEVRDGLKKLSNYLCAFDALACSVPESEFLLKPTELHEFLTRAIEDLERIDDIFDVVDAVG